MTALVLYLLLGFTFAVWLVAANASSDGRIPFHMGNHTVLVAPLGVLVVLLWPLVALLAVLAFVHGLFGGKP